MKLRTLTWACCRPALCVRRTCRSITIATVNNGDMVRMQKLTGRLQQGQPDIKLNWVTLEENVLRERHHRHRHQGRPV